MKSMFSQEFTASSRTTFESESDLILNITKRWTDVYYRTAVDEAQVLLSYIRSGTLSADGNLRIVDRSADILEENRVLDLSAFETVESSASITSPTDRILITDVFVTGTSLEEDSPLFYGHQISSGHFSYSSGHRITSLAVLDEELAEVSDVDTYLDTTNGILYSNLTSSHDSVNQAYSLYYLRYSVKESSTVVKTYTVMLDNSPVYSLADIDDIDAWGGLLRDGRKVYLKEQSSDGSWVFTFPTSGTYAYRATSRTRLEVLHPVEGEAQDPWFVGIRDAVFYAQAAGTTYKYHLAEVENQYFDPYAPVRFAYKETATVLNKNTIKLGYEDIVEDSDENLYISVLLYNTAGNLLYALTTDSSLHNTYAGQNDAGTNISYSRIDSGGSHGIRSVDHLGGFLDIRGVDLKSSYIAKCSYYYNYADYPFRLVNFNPTHNRNILDHTIAFFIVPDTLVSSRTKTLYYMKFNEDGRVVYSDWADFDNTTQLLTSGKYLFYGDAPSWFSSYYGAGNVVNFTDTYTVDGSGYYLVLAEVSFGA